MLIVPFDIGDLHSMIHICKLIQVHMFCGKGVGLNEIELRNDSITDFKELSLHISIFSERNSVWTYIALNSLYRNDSNSFKSQNSFKQHSARRKVELTLIIKETLMS